MIRMIIVGIIAGALASWLVPVNERFNLWMKMALGICGAIVAGFLGSLTGLYSTENAPAGIIASTVGAVIILFGLRMLTPRR